MPPDNEVKRWILLYYRPVSILTSFRFWNEIGSRVYEEARKEAKASGDVRPICLDLRRYRWGHQNHAALYTGGPGGRYVREGGRSQSGGWYPGRHAKAVRHDGVYGATGLAADILLDTYHSDPTRAVLRRRQPRSWAGWSPPRPNAVGNFFPASMHPFWACNSPGEPAAS